MSSIFLKQLFPDRPFFGGLTQGYQGNIQRHLYMIAAVYALGQNRTAPVRLLEVGSWIGLSALTWAAAIEQWHGGRGSVLCIDPWRPYFKTTDLQADAVYQNMNALATLGHAYDLFLHNVSFSRNVGIHHFRGTLAEATPYLKENGFDLIYIDGSHYYREVLNDLRLAATLLAPGGLLCGDDLELQAHECNLELARAHPESDYIRDDPSGTSFHPGVTTAVFDFFGREVSSRIGFWAMRKESGDQGFAPIDFDQLSTFVPSHLSNIAATA